MAEALIKCLFDSSICSGIQTVVGMKVKLKCTVLCSGEVSEAKSRG